MWESLTSHNPTGLHGLLERDLYLFFGRDIMGISLLYEIILYRYKYVSEFVMVDSRVLNREVKGTNNSQQ